MQNFSQTQLDRLADIVRKTRPLFENTELLSSVHQKGQADFVTDVDYQVQSLSLIHISKNWLPFWRTWLATYN